MFCKVGAESTDVLVEFFQGTKNDYLHRVTEMGHLRSPETVIIHVGTSDLRTTRNINFVLGEVYAFVATAKGKFPLI